MLERLENLCHCIECDNMAYWSWATFPLCYTHLRAMAEMNSDNEDAVHEALISPVIAYVTRNQVGLLIYPTTWISSICALLNQILPDLDHEAEICINFMQEGEQRLECRGRGYYILDTTTTHCHAPLITLARAPVGCMSGFMKMLNDHSMRIRACVAQEQEFGEEIPNG